MQTTAAAFTKGFLDLEGALPPILASLVSKDKSATAMLDDTNEQGRLGMDRSKAVISRLLNCPQTTAGAIAAQESSRPPSPSSKQPRGLERGLEHGQIVAQAYPPPPHIPPPHLPYLPHISPTSPPHLPHISRARRPRRRRRAASPPTPSSPPG